MKTPNTTEAVPSALDRVHSIGSFPKQRNTVIAEVLAQLLVGRHISGMDAVFAANTTRLASTIHSLIRGHLWNISHTDVVIQTNDGRVTEIRRYHLKQRIIEAAIEAGGREFCSSVDVARKSLRRAPQPLPISYQHPAAV